MGEVVGWGADHRRVEGETSSSLSITHGNQFGPPPSSELLQEVEFQPSFAYLVSRLPLYTYSSSIPKDCGLECMSCGKATTSIQDPARGRESPETLGGTLLWMNLVHSSSIQTFQTSQHSLQLSSTIGIQVRQQLGGGISLWQ